MIVTEHLTNRVVVLLLLLILAVRGRADDKPASATRPPAKDPVLRRVEEHARQHARGDVAHSWDQSAYRSLADESWNDLPIGVFDSGIGGLTVLEVLLTADVFHNDTLQPGADGRPDFAGERFVYLGDQANMPYGNYPTHGREDFLRELILKDAVFLLGRRFHQRQAGGALRVSMDKRPVKAIVIACNTATAYGLESIREALQRWELPIPVVGVVEAGARGVQEAPGEGAVGVLATVGTCASEVYPRTIAQTLGRAGRRVPIVAQWGSAQLAGVIEGDPALATTLHQQVAADVRALVEAHRDRTQAEPGAPVVPLQKIVLGCTHYPLVTTELDAALAALRTKPEFTPWIAAQREFVNPAEWTARELWRELARTRRRRSSGSSSDQRAVTRPEARFFLSTANDACTESRRSAPGVLESNYKYSRSVGQLDVEDTVVVPLTRSLLPEVSRKLVQDKLPTVWRFVPES